MNREEDRTTSPYAIAAAVLAALLIVYLARRVLLPFAIAFALAYLLDPLVDRIEKLKVSRTLGVLILLSAFFALFAVAVTVLIPVLQLQVHHLVESLPRYIGTLESWVRPFLDRLAGLDAHKVQAIINDGMKQFGELPLKLVSGASSFLWGSLSSLFNILLLVFNLIIIPVAGFYLLRDYDLIVGKALGLVPPRHRARTAETVAEINRVLANFVRGQLMVSSLMAALYSAGLYLCGTPMSLLLGMIAGFANLVPYMGLVFGFVPAALLTWLQHQEAASLLGVAAVFGVVQTLEGTVVTPRIVGDKIGLHPVAIMLAVLAGAEFFGFLGVLLAVPTAAVVNVLLARGLVTYRKSSFYN